MSRRNREKRRRHKQTPPANLGKMPEAVAFLRNFEKHVNTPSPITWPGACDESLARPDLVKFDFAEFAIRKEPGRSKSLRFQRAMKNGPLGFMKRHLDDWALEEFLWHGVAGDDWSPMDQFLAQAKDRFSEQASAQLRLWKEARFGFYAVGPVADDLVTLCEWDPARQTTISANFQAISLSIGGVNIYKAQRNGILLTYVAPWRPENGIYCAMGYGMVLPPEEAVAFLPMLALRKTQAIVHPYPWHATPSSRNEFARIWRTRDWHTWLGERVEFPFAALLIMDNSMPTLHQVMSILPASREWAERYGIYLEVDMDGEPGVIGVTNLMPTDLTSAGSLALAEYCAYRHMVGPPPGVRDMPGTFQILPTDELEQDDALEEDDDD